MRNAKWMCTILAAAVMGVFLVYNPGSVQAADPIKLNYSIFFPAPHKNTVLATEWAQEVEKRTNGAVRPATRALCRCLVSDRRPLVPPGR